MCLGNPLWNHVALPCQQMSAATKLAVPFHHPGPDALAHPLGCLEVEGFSLFNLLANSPKEDFFFILACLLSGLKRASVFPRNQWEQKWLKFKGCKHLAVIMTGLISAEPACCYSAAKQATNG